MINRTFKTLCLLITTSGIINAQLVVSGTVYPAKPVTEAPNGKLVVHLPGATCKVTEVWPMHLVVLFADGTTAKIDRKIVSLTPLSDDAIKAAIKARLGELPVAIETVKGSIASLEEKVIRKRANGTLKRKVIEETKTSMKTTDSKEEVELKELKAQLKTLEGEQLELQKLSGGKSA